MNVNTLPVSNLVYGSIPAGESCFASSACEVKHMACNGNGCPVSDGKTIDRCFSCATVRLFELYH